MKWLKKTLKKYNDIPILAKVTLWFMFCSIVQKSISLLTTPIFTRLMTPTQYGQFSLYNSWLQIFTIFVTLRLNYAVFNKGMSKYKDDRDGYTSTMQSITFVFALIFFIVYLLFHNQINSITELPTLVMVAIFAELLFTPAIDFWTVRKRYEYIYKPVVFRTLLMAVLNAALGVFAVCVTEEKGYARIITCVLVNFCFGIPLYIYNRKKGKIWFNKEYAVFALTFNLPLLLHYVSQYILEQFDRIMIAKMVGIAAAGIYSVAYNAGMILKIVTQSINNALIPWQYDKLEKRQFKELDDVQFLIFVIVSGCALLFSAFAPEIMCILADEKYHEAVYVIPPVALALVFSFMFTTFANTEFYFNQTRFTMLISMVGAALNIGLNYIGIKLFGYVAAAYTTLICYIVFSFSHYIYMTTRIKKTLNLDKVFNTRRLLWLSTSVLFFGISMILFYDQTLIRYGIVIVIMIGMIIKRNLIINTLKAVKSVSASKGDI
ncbi:lipopolysaccharide biosynthesis protein [Acetobacterium wieringae]|uniref:lipopolysaccharide biosynthesis protein n=1 Tax=Acetobacterium wieringae TaxID=52694 RepID=UPI0026ED131A|nr:oligosaccharide flippase family protein [Acetobacterium wieringae]